MVYRHLMGRNGLRVKEPNAEVVARSTERGGARSPHEAQLLPLNHAREERRAHAARTLSDRLSGERSVQDDRVPRLTANLERALMVPNQLRASINVY